MPVGDMFPSRAPTTNTHALTPRRRNVKKKRHANRSWPSQNTSIPLPRVSDLSIPPLPPPPQHRTKTKHPNTRGSWNTPATTRFPQDSSATAQITARKLSLRIRPCRHRTTSLRQEAPRQPPVEARRAALLLAPPTRGPRGMMASAAPLAAARAGKQTARKAATVTGGGRV